MPEEFEEGQDPFVGVTTEPLDLDAEVERHQAGLERHRLQNRLERLRREQQERRARWRERARKRNRVHFRWPRQLVEVIKRIADSERVSQSQVSAFLMALAIRAYRNGAIDPAPYKRPSRSPRYKYSLDLDGWDSGNTHANLDWPNRISSALEQIASCEDVSQAHVSAFLMRFAVDAYLDGAVDMTPYKEPVEFELDIPELGENRVGIFAPNSANPL